MRALNGTNLLATLLIGFMLQGSGLAADWPQWRGPTGDGHAQGVRGIGSIALRRNGRKSAIHDAPGEEMLESAREIC